VHDEHTGALALLRIVPGEEAFQDGVALLVLDGLRLDRRLHARNVANARQRNERQ
jgi:hypothetical protein